MDIASLGIEVKNQGVDAATKSLNDLKTAAAGAETATGNLTAGTTRAAAGLNTEAAAAKSTAGAMRDVAHGTEKTATTQGAMTKQALGGARALTAMEVAAQEAGMTLGGYELSLRRAAKEQDAFNASARQAAMNPARTPTISGGAGVPSISARPLAEVERSAAGAARAVGTLNTQAGNAARSLVNMAGGGVVAATSIDALVTAGLLLNPVVLAIAAGLAIAYGALELFKADTDKAADQDAFIKSLGLSKKELKQLGDTSITSGDMLKGLWRTIDQGGHASEVFNTVKEAGVGAFRFILESVEWFVAGSIAGLNAVAHAAKGIAMVLTGDFSGFDYFNHSLDNLISDTKAAKASMDTFWASVQKNTIAVNHERVSAAAAAIKADRTAKRVAEGEYDGPFKVAKQRDEGSITKKVGDTLGKDGWADIKVPSIVITSVDDLARANIYLIDTYADLRRAGGETAKTIGDAFYDAATGANTFFGSIVGGLQRMVAAWAANDIEHIFNKLFHVDDSKTYKASPMGGIMDVVGSWFGGGGSSSAYSVKAADNSPISAYPSFAGGGFTGNGPRSGGVDGKGGFYSIMHPQETVTDHTKGGGNFDPQEMAMAFIGHLTKELDRRAASNRTYSDTQIYGFNRALPKRLGQINRQGT